MLCGLGILGIILFLWATLAAAIVGGGIMYLGLRDGGWVDKYLV